jgi:hypothetical protein
MRILLLYHACHMERGVASSPLLAGENLRFMILRIFAAEAYRGCFKTVM